MLCPRKDPSYPVGDVEEFLIDHHAKEVRADILQVGHHGSKTSSRRGFLEAVHPSLALVSSGPKRYGKVTLPDIEVIESLERERERQLAAIPVVVHEARVLSVSEYMVLCKVEGLTFNPKLDGPAKVKRGDTVRVTVQGQRVLYLETTASSGKVQRHKPR